LTPSSPTETAESPETLFVPVATSEFSTPISESTEQSETPPGGSVTPDPIFGLLEPLIAGIYDDADAGLAYIGVWNPEENIDAYQRTIFVSEAVDDYLAFSFIGYQLNVGYQSSDEAGEITIDVDGVEMTVTQQVGSLWISGEFPLETHYVTITHTGEGPVNLDYIEIPE
jgi:hypothetical protein